MREKEERRTMQHEFLLSWEDLHTSRCNWNDQYAAPRILDQNWSTL